MARCSAPPSPAPSSTSRPCSSPTNRRATWTPGNGTRVLELLTELNALAGADHPAGDPRAGHRRGRPPHAAHARRAVRRRRTRPRPWPAATPTRCRRLMLRLFRQVILRQLRAETTPHRHHHRRRRRRHRRGAGHPPDQRQRGARVRGRPGPDVGTRRARDRRRRIRHLRAGAAGDRLAARVRHHEPGHRRRRAGRGRAPGLSDPAPADPDRARVPATRLVEPRGPNCSASWAWTSSATSRCATTRWATPAPDAPPPQTATDILGLLTDPEAAVITRAFADRHGLHGRRSAAQSSSATARRRCACGHCSRPKGPAKLLDGNFLLMDLAAAQWAFERLGRVDRIDMTLADGVDIAAAERAIAARLPTGLTVQRPSRRGAAGGADARGVSPEPDGAVVDRAARGPVPRLQRGVRVGAGTAAGDRHPAGAGRDAAGRCRRCSWARRPCSASLGRRAGHSAGARARRRDGRADVDGPSTRCTWRRPRRRRRWAGATCCWPCSSAFRCPCWPPGCPRAKRRGVPPTAVLRGADRAQARTSRQTRTRWLAAALLALGRRPQPDAAGRRPAAGRLPRELRARLRRGPADARRCCRPPRARAGRCGTALFGVGGWLAHAALGGAIGRVAVSVAALAVSLAMMVAITVMVGSFRQTVIDWVGQSLQADLFVGPASRAQRRTRADHLARGRRRRARAPARSRPSTRSAR